MRRGAPLECAAVHINMEFIDACLLGDLARAQQSSAPRESDFGDLVAEVIELGHADVAAWLIKEHPVLVRDEHIIEALRADQFGLADALLAVFDQTQSALYCLTAWNYEALCEFGTKPEKIRRIRWIADNCLAAEGGPLTVRVAVRDDHGNETSLLDDMSPNIDIYAEGFRIGEEVGFRTDWPAMYADSSEEVLRWLVTRYELTLDEIKGRADWRGVVAECFRGAIVPDRRPFTARPEPGRAGLFGLAPDDVRDLMAYACEREPSGRLRSAGLCFFLLESAAAEDTRARLPEMIEAMLSAYAGGFVDDQTPHLATVCFAIRVAGADLESIKSKLNAACSRTPGCYVVAELVAAGYRIDDLGLEPENRIKYDRIGARL